ncbi:hypothetical protein ACROYT_G035620 [Oculina patagonica]
MADRAPDIFDTEPEGESDEENVEEEEPEEEEDPEEEEEENSSSSEEEGEKKATENLLRTFEMDSPVSNVMHEDDMDFDEGAESAVEKRKFLLNRVMTKKLLPDEPDDDEEKEDEREEEVEAANSSVKFEEGSEESSSVHEINTAQADSNPHALVLSTFGTIWNAVNQFSSLLTPFLFLINSIAQIFSGVGFPHPVPLNLLEDLAKPTREEAIQFLGRLCSCLAFVVNAIQSVLQEPKGSETGNYQLFETLLQAITQFV